MNGPLFNVFTSTDCKAKKWAKKQDNLVYNITLQTDTQTHTCKYTDLKITSTHNIKCAYYNNALKNTNLTDYEIRQK